MFNNCTVRALQTSDFKITFKKPQTNQLTGLNTSISLQYLQYKLNIVYTHSEKKKNYMHTNELQ